jgi:hypothetical protein
MPKTYPKTQPKKTKTKKKQLRTQPKFSLMKSKFYWITLALTILVFTVAYGYLMQISIGKELLILGSIFSVMGFAFYVGFKASENYSKRATFIFVGASIVGFSIWAAMVLSFNATGFTSQISSSIGVDFFAITSLVICLIVGAFMGDLIGKNRESLSVFVNSKLRK